MRLCSISNSVAGKVITTLSLRSSACRVDNHIFDKQAQSLISIAEVVLQAATNVPIYSMSLNTIGLQTSSTHKCEFVHRRHGAVLISKS